MTMGFHSTTFLLAEAIFFSTQNRSLFAIKAHREHLFFKTAKLRTTRLSLHIFLLLFTYLLAKNKDIPK